MTLFEDAGPSLVQFFSRQLRKCDVEIGKLFLGSLHSADESQAGERRGSRTGQRRVIGIPRRLGIQYKRPAPL